MQLKLTDIDRDPKNPRPKLTANDVETLAASLKTIGLLNPIRVRKHEKQSGRWVIVAGERRWSAANALGWKEIWAEEVSDFENAELIRIAENEGREGIHPLDQAKAVKRAVKQFGSFEETQKHMSMRKDRLRHLIELDSLPMSIKKLYGEGRLTWELIRLLVQARNNETREKLAEEWAGNEWNGPTPIENARRDLQRSMRRVKEAPWDLSKAFEFAPECSVCPSNTSTDDVLFADLADDGYCTDGECWQRKLNTHLDEQMSVYRQLGEKVWTWEEGLKKNFVAKWGDGSGRAYVDVDGTISDFAIESKSQKKVWSALPKATRDALKLVLVADPRTGTVRRLTSREPLVQAMLKGKILTPQAFGYENAKEMKEHGEMLNPGKAPVGETDEEKKKRLAAGKREREKISFNQEVLNELTEKIGVVAELTPVELDPLINFLGLIACDTFGYDEVERVAKARGFSQKQAFASDYVKFLKPKMAPAQVALKIIMELALMRFRPSKRHPALPKEVKDLAAALGYDWKDLEKTVREKIKEAKN